MRPKGEILRVVIRLNRLHINQMIEQYKESFCDYEERSCYE